MGFTHHDSHVYPCFYLSYLNDISAGSCFGVQSSFTLVNGFLTLFGMTIFANAEMERKEGRKAPFFSLPLKPKTISVIPNEVRNLTQLISG